MYGTELYTKKGKGKPLPFVLFVLVENIDNDVLVLTLSDRAHQGADLFCYLAVTADHLAHIVGGNAKGENGLVAVVSLGDYHGIGRINEILRDIGKKLLQGLAPDQRTPAFLSRVLTVSVG